jgi:hypothetical protein
MFGCEMFGRLIDGRFALMLGCEMFGRETLGREMFAAPPPPRFGREILGRAPPP